MGRAGLICGLGYLSTTYAKKAGFTMGSLATVYANSLSLGNGDTLGNGESNMLGAAWYPAQVLSADV